MSSERGKTMPFGAHKGKPMASVPSDYLTWFVNNIRGCDDLKRAARNVLEQRQTQCTINRKPLAKREKKSIKKLAHCPSIVKRAPPYRGAHPIPHDVVLGPSDEECPFDTDGPNSEQIEMGNRPIIGT